jgi:hypothetical protein
MERKRQRTWTESTKVYSVDKSNLIRVLKVVLDLKSYFSNAILDSKYDTLRNSITSHICRSYMQEEYNTSAQAIAARIASKTSKSQTSLPNT